MNVMSTDTQSGRRIPMSWQEYEELGTEARGEYIDGALVVSPLASRRHQRACRRLLNLIEAALPDGSDVAGTWGWKVGDDEFGPDVMVFDETDKDVRYTGTPHLCVEVLSTDRAADLVRKFAKYADAGLPRYWIVDLDVPEITVFELTSEGGYREAQRVSGAQEASLDVGPTQMTLAPSELVS